MLHSTPALYTISRYKTRRHTMEQHVKKLIRYRGQYDIHASIYKSDRFLEEFKSNSVMPWCQCHRFTNAILVLISVFTAYVNLLSRQIVKQWIYSRLYLTVGM